MNATVEGTPKTRWGKDEHHAKGVIEDRQETVSALNQCFVNFLYTINTSSNRFGLEADLRRIALFGSTLLFDYFTYGFGGNHMWVKQVDSEGEVRGERLIFVEFEN